MAFAELHELQRIVTSRVPVLVGRLRELVEVESPSEDAAAVNRAGELVTRWAAEMGARVIRHNGDGFGQVLEIWFGPEGAGAGRPVLLLGHLDTVWPMGTLETMPWREQDGRLCGPGVVDMKAGIVMALEAVGALQETGKLGHSTGRPVCLLLHPDEEVGSPTSRAHTERLARQSEAVFVLEPAQGLAYKTARKGVGHWELQVEGVAAHAGVDFSAGKSAIRTMADLVTKISSWTDLTRGLTVNVGTISGGTRSNVVPAHCRAEVDARVVTMADAAMMEERFAQLTAPEGLRLTVTGGINRPPMERGEGTVRLFRQAQTLAAELGLKLEEAATGGGSDGNFTAALGVPTLDGMGAVGGGAHAAHEYAERAHLPERTVLLAGMIAGVRDERTERREEGQR